MRFLCISDIHGNAAALRRVLDEASDREFHQLVVCGDSLFPGAEPLETWKLLLKHRALCVQGLSDRALYELDPKQLSAATAEQEQRLQRLAEVKKEVGELIVARLGKLPTSATLPLESGHKAIVVHGSPADPTESLSLEMADDEVAPLLGDAGVQVVICGSSHVPFHRQVGETEIIGVGSVGEAPTPNVAYATIIDSSEAGFRVEQFEVDL